MSRAIIQTHAGDDSDGKIWGIEGANILFLLGGLLIAIGLALLLARHYPPSFSFGMGSVPFVAVAAYVLGLRQGRPKSFDTDLIETLGGGSAWMPPARQPRNPLHSHAGA